MQRATKDDGLLFLIWSDLDILDVVKTDDAPGFQRRSW